MVIELKLRGHLVDYWFLFAPTSKVIRIDAVYIGLSCRATSTGEVACNQQQSENGSTHRLTRIYDYHIHTLKLAHWFQRLTDQ